MSSLPLKLSPLYEVAAHAGAQFSLCEGWQVAQVYTSAQDEAALARQGVGLADQSAQGKILVEGREAASHPSIRILPLTLWSASPTPPRASAASASAEV